MLQYAKLLKCSWELQDSFYHLAQHCCIFIKLVNYLPTTLYSFEAVSSSSEPLSQKTILATSCDHFEAHIPPRAVSKLKSKTPMPLQVMFKLVDVFDMVQTLCCSSGRGVVKSLYTEAILEHNLKRYFIGSENLIPMCPMPLYWKRGITVAFLL